jgi:hypothetical protein
MDPKTSYNLLDLLGDDSDPDAQDAAWWRLQFEWRHERLEEKERKRGLMAGEAWRSLIPKVKTDSDLRIERGAAEAASNIATWFLLWVAFTVAIALGVGVGIGITK